MSEQVTITFHAVISRDAASRQFVADVAGLPIRVSAAGISELDHLLCEAIKQATGTDERPDMEWSYTSGGVVLLARREGLLPAFLALVLGHEVRKVSDAS